jgi:hypothetical protein
MATTHGLSKTREYAVWCGMISRCAATSGPDYARYAGRGIKVCERWRKFENFWADMGPAPPGTELDREDNNGDYTPNNCRWLDHKGQSNNRRNNFRVEYAGETKTLAQWAEDPRCVVDFDTFRQRIRRCKWSIEKALTTPHRGWGPKAPYGHNIHFELEQ